MAFADAADRCEVVRDSVGLLGLPLLLAVLPRVLLAPWSGCSPVACCVMKGLLSSATGQGAALAAGASGAAGDGQAGAGAGAVAGAWGLLPACMQRHVLVRDGPHDGTWPEAQYQHVLPLHSSTSCGPAIPQASVGRSCSCTRPGACLPPTCTSTAPPSRPSRWPLSLLRTTWPRNALWIISAASSGGRPGSSSGMSSGGAGTPAAASTTSMPSSARPGWLCLRISAICGATDTR